MPDALAKGAGALQKAWAQMRCTTPQLTPDLVEIYKHDWAYRSTAPPTRRNGLAACP